MSAAGELPQHSTNPTEPLVMNTTRRQLATLPIPTCPIGERVPAEVLGAMFDDATRTYHWMTR